MNEVPSINDNNQNNGDNVAISKDLTNVIKGRGYKDIEQGFFNKVPGIQGQLYKFSSDKTNTTYLVINTNPNFIYEKGIVELKNHTFFIINARDVEDASDAIKSIAGNIVKTIQKKNNIKEQDLPYGYTKDETGKPVLVPDEAEEVRKMFRIFPSVGSIRKTADQLRTNFSHVREILHDARYGEINPSIVPLTDLKRVKHLLFQNRKNRTTAKENKMAIIKRQIASGIRG